MIDRGPDRREEGRRDVDRRTHLLEQAVLSAAVSFTQLDPEAPSEERIRLHRQLRERVSSYLEFAERGAADALDLLLMSLVAVIIIVPGSLVGQGWGRWLLAMLGLSACAVILVRGERRRER